MVLIRVFQRFSYTKRYSVILENPFKGLTIRTLLETIKRYVTKPFRHLRVLQKTVSPEWYYKKSLGSLYSCIIDHHQ